ncbi:MAG: DUF2855 family protein [Acidimicrobiia bacterium]|nr:DUF2855 family protein [Acidimicrobiia bacterium]
MTTTLQVDTTDIAHTRIHTIQADDDGDGEGTDGEFGPGRVRLAVESFALTANNITYASAGSFLGYWDFFPTGDEPWGQVPAMGYARMLESTVDGVEPGARYFGFVPMGDEVVIEAKATSTGLWASGAHREAHAPAYRQFTDLASDPDHDPAREPHVALLRGLFMTSYLAEDMLAEADNHGATATVITSASSKTSIALAWCVQQRGHRAIGLTSTRNHQVVASLGCYDEVCTYDEIARLDGTEPVVVVDMAGNGAVLEQVHRHYGDNLAFSLTVGATHHDADRATPDLPGPTPEFFFAPGQIEKRSADWGPGELMKRMGGRFDQFVDFSDGWLEIVRCSGPDAVTAAYHDVLEGRRSPTEGLICSM